tara:strand:+ start:1264 stop:1797 length:534 start_codon:yes stop_codon:yes gene_type:complete
MNFKNTKKAFETFAALVVQQARNNLTRKNKNASGDLFKSLGHRLNVGKNSIELEFFMEDYGMFQDQGVRGSLSTYRESQNSKFSFTNKRPPAKPLEKWLKLKRFQFRDKQGKFMSYKNMSYIIANSMFKKGIKASLFFTKPFEDAFLKLPEEIIQKFALDIDDLFDFSVDDPIKRNE